MTQQEKKYSNRLEVRMIVFICVYFGHPIVINMTIRLYGDTTDKLHVDDKTIPFCVVYGVIKHYLLTVNVIKTVLNFQIIWTWL
jgi:hypothetical protein